MARFSEASSHVFDHPIRSRIIAYLRAKTCASENELCRSVQISRGVAQHHLYVLERAGILFSKPFGRERLFFLMENRTTLGETMTLALRNPRARQIADQVEANPGIRQRELVQRINVTRKVFRLHMGRLVAAGLVQETRNVGKRTYSTHASVRDQLRCLLQGGG